jgi:hypothetical protein
MPHAHVERRSKFTDFALESSSILSRFLRHVILFCGSVFRRVELVAVESLGFNPTA